MVGAFGAPLTTCCTMRWNSRGPINRLHQRLPLFCCRSSIVPLSRMENRPISTKWHFFLPSTHDSAAIFSMAGHSTSKTRPNLRQTVLANFPSRCIAVEAGLPVVAQKTLVDRFICLSVVI